ncbi:alpha/beta hydrolase [Halogeometricum sp. S1BR25-6]|uniref:Alpha/beta hydrolase n=1 Tax=Halogeometricum salsisoli TaxID=2950536 RepID=A0ABU2GLD1_9EURY|nr:alpha/beta hydrolase [Halogeometricum sp. S1BR25-6]MDS0301093.1 alpha/beta hydrolase [Halogeometricum sp. S1BR25-6]
METVTSADGTLIAFERTGSGPPVVLVHGMGFDHTFWDLSSVRSALAAHYTVYAIDRRGRGGSGDTDEYDLECELEDVAAVVESIDEPVTLLGHSFGAVVALNAADRIDTLQGLVLYEPGISFEEGFPVMEQLLGTIRPLITDGEKEQALLTLLNTVRMPEPSVKELRSGANWQELVDAADTLPREFEQLIEYEFEHDRFRDVTIPTLLLVGEESSPGANDTTKTLDETLPDSRIVRIDGADHFGLISKPDRCVEEILAFRHNRK